MFSFQQRLQDDSASVPGPGLTTRGLFSEQVADGPDHHVSEYRGVPVLASDLRAAASLVLAGLAAKGKTIIEGVHHLDRGYEQMEEKLALCGADIYRIGDN